MRDMKTNISVAYSIEPVAVGTTGTGKTGVAVDLQGADSATVVFGYGAITATAATFTATLLEADATGDAFTSVADADMVGTEANAGLAGGARVDGSTEKVFKTLGYIGTKRYIKAKIVSTATAGTPVSAAVVKSHLSRSGSGV